MGREKERGEVCVCGGDIIRNECDEEAEFSKQARNEFIKWCRSSKRHGGNFINISQGQWENVLATKTDNLSFIPVSTLWKERTSLYPGCYTVQAHYCTHKHVLNK